MALLAVKWFNVSVTGMSSKEAAPVMKERSVENNQNLVVYICSPALPNRTKLVSFWLQARSPVSSPIMSRAHQTYSAIQALNQMGVQAFCGWPLVN